MAYFCPGEVVIFTVVCFYQELQDRIDELQSELEEYRTQEKVFRPSLKSSLSEELDAKSSVEPDQGKGYFMCVCLGTAYFAMSKVAARRT